LQAAAEARCIALDGALRQRATEAGMLGTWRGRRVYVKAFAPESDERLATQLLRSWIGGPVAEVLDADADVQVLEWVEPGHTLESQYDDLGDEASLLVLADIAAALQRLGAAGHGYASAIRRAASLIDGARPACIDASLWQLARSRYLALAESQSRTAVVHGDLHHGNVLWDRTRGWVTIDPKGVIAELEFELACALRNPIARLNDWCRNERVAHRANVVARRLNIDARRLLEWTFAQSVLAVAWEVEDGLDPTPWSIVARALAAELL
jgi:streptomycin 6-kinase